MTEQDHTVNAAVSLRVTIQDLRDARYCLAGVRPWFRRHGFDWQVFLESGIEAVALRATSDALVEPVIRQAEAREATRTHAVTDAGSTPSLTEPRDGQ